jgi:hypothetical protein
VAAAPLLLGVGFLGDPSHGDGFNNRRGAS